MSFRPEVGDKLDINGIIYEITEHPAAPGMPYGQEGRQAVVYKIAAEIKGKNNAITTDRKAIKVFKAQHRIPGMVSLAEKLAPFAVVPGLQVCSRYVLTPRNSEKLLQEHNDLVYSVIMPWVEGPTWMEVMLDQMALSKDQCLNLAHAFVDMLSYMEEYGVAHCDLSAPNVLIPMLSDNPTALNPVCLVDVEQLFGPNLPRPELLPGGSPGYAHKCAPAGLWGANADRFSGAVILAEILCWCDERIRNEAWGENYYDPKEIQNLGSARYSLMLKVLEEQWGKSAADLFKRAWQSDSLSECATFAEWLIALPPMEKKAKPVKKRVNLVSEDKGLGGIPGFEQSLTSSSLFASITDEEKPRPEKKIITCNCGRKLEFPHEKNKIVCPGCETEWLRNLEGNIVSTGVYNVERKNSGSKVPIIIGILILCLIPLAYWLYNNYASARSEKTPILVNTSSSPPEPGKLLIKTDIRGAKVKLSDIAGKLVKQIDQTGDFYELKEIIKSGSNVGIVLEKNGEKHNCTPGAVLTDGWVVNDVTDDSITLKSSDGKESRLLKTALKGRPSPPFTDELILDSGPYIISISKPGYYDITKGDNKSGFEIAGGRTTELNESWIAKSSITVKTNEDARIYLNGKEIGITKNKQLALKNLDPGTFNIIAKKDDYKELKKTVKIETKGQNINLSLNLEKLPQAAAPSYSGGNSGYSGGGYSGSGYSSGGSSGSGYSGGGSSSSGSSGSGSSGRSSSGGGWSPDDF